MKKHRPYFHSINILYDFFKCREENLFFLKNLDKLNFLGILRQGSLMDKFLDTHPDDSRWGHAFVEGSPGVRLHYVRQGQGQTILFLHGWPGFWYDWRRILSLLHDSPFDRIALDLRGFNQSDKPDLPPQKGYALQNFTEDLHGFCQKLSLSSVILVAYDLGAVVAQKFAQLYPDLIQGLVLLNPPYGGIGSRCFEEKFLQERWYYLFHRVPWSDQLVNYDWVTTHIYINHFYQAWLKQKNSLRPKECEAIIEIFCRSNMFRSSISWFRTQEAWSILQEPPTLKITSPTEILWSDSDPLLPVSWSDRLGEYFQQYSLTLLKDIGHFVPFEAPQAVIQAISRLCP